MNDFTCPYCGQPKTATPPDEFSCCKFCGFKSALIFSGNRKMLIVDREMPYLSQRCRELSVKLPDVEIVVDRRVVQDPLKNKERRAPVKPCDKSSSSSSAFTSFQDPAS